MLTNLPTPAMTPSPCARPNIDATTLHALEPVVPWSVARFAYNGTVQVAVFLDATDAVTGVRLQRTPFRGVSSPLNTLALDAARGSTFQGTVRDCRRRADWYIFTVDFNNTLPVAYVDPHASPPVVVVNGRGIVPKDVRGASRDADVATATVRAQNDADDAANVLAAPNGFRVVRLVARRVHAIDAKSVYGVGEGLTDPPIHPGDLVVYVRATYALERTPM